jgi:hypothetical protein
MKGLGIILSAWLLACFISCSDPQPRNEFCVSGIYVDSNYERFCIPRTDLLESNIDLHDTLYQHYYRHDSSVLVSSENYVGFLLSMVSHNIEGTSKEDMINFYQELQNIMFPSSTHKFDISDQGGFVIELWDQDGNYFSSELTDDNQQAMLRVERTILTIMEPPSEFHYSGIMYIDLVPTGPIIVSNKEKTIMRQIEFDTPITFTIIFDTMI